MRLDEACKLFIAQPGQNESPSLGPVTQSLELFIEYFPPVATLNDITSTSVRDFLSRCCVENAIRENSSDISVGVQAIVDSLRGFFTWAGEAFSVDLDDPLAVLRELERTVPRAIKIARSLSNALAERGGAFSFPEYLTSFEEGGRSHYDIDVDGEIGTMEGYFRIARIEGSRVEAEETISEKMVGPIIFPQDVAERLAEGYIINLEIIRASNAWQIVDCGFVYPPGTEL